MKRDDLFHHLEQDNISHSFIKICDAGTLDSACKPQTNRLFLNQPTSIAAVFQEKTYY